MIKVIESINKDFPIIAELGSAEIYHNEDTEETVIRTYGPSGSYGPSAISSVFDINKLDELSDYIDFFEKKNWRRYQSTLDYSNALVKSLDKYGFKKVDITKLYNREV